MTDRPPPVQMLEVAPYLPVADVEAAADHYRRVLGFDVGPFAGDPPAFVVVSRDGIAVMLRRAEPRAARGGSATDVYIWVTDVVRLADELLDRGVDLLAVPPDRPKHDGREMAVRDLDGNVICFGQLLD